MNFSPRTFFKFLTFNYHSESPVHIQNVSNSPSRLLRHTPLPPPRPQPPSTNLPPKPILPAANTITNPYRGLLNLPHPQRLRKFRNSSISAISTSPILRQHQIAHPLRLLPSSTPLRPPTPRALHTRPPRPAKRISATPSPSASRPTPRRA